MGTPEFAVPSLHAVAARADVVQVVTRPDRARGRGRAVGPSPVAGAAAALGLPVAKPADLRTPAAREPLAALGPDLFAVVAYGAILDRALLGVPRLGSINLHASLLPEYRGASPVQRALWDGRAWTGVTTMWMAEGLDTGDCILQRCVAIEPGDDAATLSGRLAIEGAPLLAESVLLAHAGRAPRQRQPADGGNYARKLAKADGAIDWTLDALAAWNRVRAVTPWPGAQTAWQGRRITVTRARPLHLLPAGAPPGTVTALAQPALHVACGRGVLAVERVRPEGRADMEAAAWARGARIGPGERFEAVRFEEEHA
jgi:methionyl-tRNA formyltransferase